MSGNNSNPSDRMPINHQGRTKFKLTPNTSFTIPKERVEPATLTPLSLSTVKKSAQGFLYEIVTDQLGNTPSNFPGIAEIKPGSTISMSAVSGSNTVTISITNPVDPNIVDEVYVQDNVTDFCAALGWWG